MDRKIEILKAFSKVCVCCSRSDSDYPMKELDLIADVITEAQEKQAITDKTSDKYNWHDLRKNQKDLPHKDDLVLIAYNEFGGIQYMTCCVGSWYWQNHSLIAWKEIDPFDEVTE